MTRSSCGGSARGTHGAVDRGTGAARRGLAVAHASIAPTGDSLVISSRCPGMIRGPTVYETVALPLSYTGEVRGVGTRSRRAAQEVRVKSAVQSGGDGRGRRE